MQTRATPLVSLPHLWWRRQRQQRQQAQVGVSRLTPAKSNPIVASKSPAPCTNALLSGAA